MTSPRPTVKGAVVALTFGLLAAFALAELTVRLAMPNWREFSASRFIQIDVVPGVGRVAIGKPGFDGYFAQNNGDFRVRVQINEHGLRNPESVDAAADRIWIVGDSMAFGWGVERDETYTSVLARETGLPTFNVASPGTDVCGYQTLLARMPEGLRPRAVVVGLILENDVHAYDCRRRAIPQPEPDKETEAAVPKSWSDVKVFLIDNSAFYNFLAITLKRVGVVRELLVDIGLIAKEHAYEERVRREDLKSLIEGTAKAIADLRDKLPAPTPVAVLIAPTRFEIRDGNPLHVEMRERMVAALSIRGLDVVDPLPGLVSEGFAPTHFVHDGHWSPLGHRIAGQALAQWVKDNAPSW